MKLKRADIIVGIPSYNEADNISFVVKQVSKGLKKYFPSLKSIIINVDNHSEDHTKEAFLSSKSEVPLKYTTTHKGVIGKGNNFRNLFNQMIELDAKVAIVVDADLKSITPEWIQKLGSPIIEGNDYVVPVYSRHKYDGTITNNICYPLIYGLFGQNIRQPIAGDFAFSRRLCEYYLTRKWNNTTYYYGIDIFMTLHALFSGFKVTQVCLGSKIHKPSAPKLGKMFVQVIYSLFKTILINKKNWKNIKHVKNQKLIVKYPKKIQELKIDDILIKRTALAEYEQHYKNIKHYLSKEIFTKVDQEFSKGKINIGPELWAGIVYDLLYKFSLHNNHLAILKAMKSLYFGRIYTFIQSSKDLSDLKSEKEIRRQAEIFRKLRPYFISKLKSKKN